MSFDLEDVPGLASPDYITLLKRLAAFNTGPLALRIGGISADRLKTVWSDDILNALVKVHQATGALGPGEDPRQGRPTQLCRQCAGNALAPCRREQRRPARAGRRRRHGGDRKQPWRATEGQLKAKAAHASSRGGLHAAPRCPGVHGAMSTAATPLSRPTLPPAQAPPLSWASACTLRTATWPPPRSSASRRCFPQRPS
jgi:hypothetical protein